MATPEVNKVQTAVYVGGQGGFVILSDNEYSSAGAIFGGEIKFKKGSFLRGQLDAGTALGGKVELGHSFDLGKNMGLELSGKAQCSSSLTEKMSLTYASAVEKGYYVDTAKGSPVSINIQDSSLNHTTWNVGHTKFSGAARLTFGSEKIKFGFGIEAGRRKNHGPEITINNKLNTDVTFEENGQQYDIVYDTPPENNTYKNEAKTYVTPTVSANIKLNKNLSLVADADLTQGSASIRYNF